MHGELDFDKLAELVKEEDEIGIDSKPEDIYIDRAGSRLEFLFVCAKSEQKELSFRGVRQYMEEIEELGFREADPGLRDYIAILLRTTAESCASSLGEVGAKVAEPYLDRDDKMLLATGKLSSKSGMEYLLYDTVNAARGLMAMAQLKGDSGEVVQRYTDEFIFTLMQEIDDQDDNFKKLAQLLSPAGSIELERFLSRKKEKRILREKIPIFRAKLMAFVEKRQVGGADIAPRVAEVDPIAPDIVKMADAEFLALLSKYPDPRELVQEVLGMDAQGQLRDLLSK